MNETPSLRAIDGAALPADYPDIGFFEVDRMVFPHEYETLTASELGSSSLSLEWYRRNPHIYTVLLCGTRVVGYCNIMPLRRDAFDAILDGTLSDGEISAEMIETFDRSGEYSVFCCGLAILEEYRLNGVGARLLVSAIFEKLRGLSERGCRISEVAAVAWTEDGRRACESLGLALVKSHAKVGEIYHSVVGRPVVAHRRNILARLARLYAAS